MIKIKPAGEFESIKERLVEVYKEAYKGLEEYAYTRRSDIKSYIKWLYKADKKGLIVAQDDDEIIGFIFFCHRWWDRIYGQIGEIHELAVIPEYHGKGVGKALVEESIKSMRRFNRIFGLWVGEHNERAKRFYEKLGFSYMGKVGKWIRMIKKE